MDRSESPSTHTTFAVCVMCADMNGFNLYALNVNVNVTFKLSIHQKSIMYLIY